MGKITDLERKSDEELWAEDGATIRGVRRILGVSLGDGARMLGVSTSFLSRMERGDAELRKELMPINDFPRRVIVDLVMRVVQRDTRGDP